MTNTKRPREPFAPWDRRTLPGLFDVDETAERVGHYKWVETKLFEALGGWVATVPELDVKLRLGTHCYHHAWHADLFDKRLPELREMKTDRLTVPANDQLVASQVKLSAKIDAYRSRTCTGRSFDFDSVHVFCSD